MVVAFAMLQSAPLSAQEPALLHVMLQGQSAEELAELVAEAGGKPTHSLPIIKAR